VAKLAEGFAVFAQARNAAVSGCAAKNAASFFGSGLPVAGSGCPACNCAKNACGVATGNTGMLFMPVRHCWPFASAKRSAMLRIGTLPSGAYGLPPGIAKRPTTGVRCPCANTCATEYGAASPLPWK